MSNQANNAPTQEQVNAGIMAELERLRQENQALREAAPKSKTDNGFKVGKSGAVSLYLGTRFPVTLYPSQWAVLMEKIQHLPAFIEANRDKISFEKVKTVKEEVTQDNVEVA